MLSTDVIRNLAPNNSQQRAREAARTGAERQAKYAKHELGRMLADTVEEYFPEETKGRRRRAARRAFIVGVAVGFLLGNTIRRP